MNESEFQAISLKRGKNPTVQTAIGFGFASRSPKNWREAFKAITKRSNCNRVVTLDSHLQTAQHLKITDYLNRGYG